MAARRLTSSRAAERGANVAGRAPRGFGTWALALQLSVRDVRRTWIPRVLRSEAVPRSAHGGNGIAPQGSDDASAQDLTPANRCTRVTVCLANILLYMTTFEDYFRGTNRNSINALKRLPHYAELLRLLDDAFESGLSHLGSGREGAALFAAMAHAAYLTAVQLGTSGQLPPSAMVTRGCVENAIYGFFLYHHPELKKIWSGRQSSPGAKQKVRNEFKIGPMKRFLTEKNKALAEQFAVVYDATIDLGAHPNALGTYSHLIKLDSGAFEWQYINTTRVDQTFALRIVAMGGLFALNIFKELFPVNFTSTGASDQIAHAHKLLLALPDPEEEATQE